MKKFVTLALTLSTLGASVASAQAVRVGMAYDAGGKADKSFNQSAYEGSQLAAKKLGVQVKDTEQLGEAFLQRHGVEFPSLYDPGSEVALAFRDFPANAIPSTVVLDREGRVAAVYTSQIPQEDLRAVLDLLLGEG